MLKDNYEINCLLQEQVNYQVPIKIYLSIDKTHTSGIYIIQNLVSTFYILYFQRYIV